MKLTKSQLREIIREEILDELAVKRTLKLNNLEVDVMDDGSAIMKTKRGVVNLSPKNYKILSRSIKQGKMESINEAGMFDDYHELNPAYMDKFIKNYKKLNRKNVVKKKGDDIYGFRKGEREAHWKFDDNYKLHYDIDKSKALGLINFFNRAKKDHPWG